MVLPSYLIRNRGFSQTLLASERRNEEIDQLFLFYSLNLEANFDMSIFTNRNWSLVYFIHN